jgi:hypoxanthine phosphoribosyltransferase
MTGHSPTRPKKVLGKTVIRARVEELGRQITADYRGKQLVLLGVLNGAFVFAADLCRAIDLDLEIDFIRVASYGSNTESSGVIRLTKAPELDVSGKEVLLVEDIVDTGATMAWLREHLRSSGAASVRICALIDKKERRTVPVEVEYAGFHLDKGFLVGYGLDCGERHRNLPAVYTLE